METKKIITTMLMVLALGAITIAAPSISFSPGGESPGGWSFNLDTFSFTQQITIDTAADALFGSTVYLPDMTISSYESSSLIPHFGTGTLLGGGQFEIRDAGGQTVLLSGEVASGSVFSIHQTASLYSEFASDIKVTAIDNSIGSNFLSRLAVGDYLDLTLSLTGASFDNMISTSGTGNGSFDGQIAPIPAPGAILLAGIGTSMVGWLRRRRAL